MQDKALLEVVRKERLERRINRCTSKIPDMRSAWQWPDSRKAPTVPEFPQDLREITIEKASKRREKETEKKRKERERRGEGSEDDAVESHMEQEAQETAGQDLDDSGLDLGDQELPTDAVVATTIENKVNSPSTIANGPQLLSSPLSRSPRKLDFEPDESRRVTQETEA